MPDKQTADKELRQLLADLGFESRRVLYGSIHYFFCRMCGGSGDWIFPIDGASAVQHRDYCPLKKALRLIEEKVSYD